MRFAVLGAGGVGGFLAALLARAGDSVEVIAREETARALATGGLRLESEHFGSFEVAVASAPRLKGPVDACLVTVKATDLRDAIARVPGDALGDGLIVPFLNGLDHVDVLRGVYGADRVAAATIRIETTRVSPGVIRHTSPFAVVDIAPWPANRDRVERIAAVLGATGIDVRVRNDEPAMLWAKFVMLAPLALLTTRERAPAGVIRDRHHDDVVALVEEFAAVAATEGVHIDPGRTVEVLDSIPPAMKTSMQRDDEAGRPLELDALGGAVIRRAAAHGVDVPLTRQVVEELQARAARPAPS